MTRQQYLEAKPTRDSSIYHSRWGCDIHHRTNRVQDACEDKMGYPYWAPGQRQAIARLDDEAYQESVTQFTESVLR